MNTNIVYLGYSFSNLYTYTFEFYIFIDTIVI